MKFFERIFACYYFLFVELRKRVKNRDDEDVSALFLFTLSQGLLFFALVISLKKLGVIYQIDISHLMVLAIIWAPFFLWYVYFISNRSRRNRIIDDYRYLSKQKKLKWKIIAFLLIVVPFVVIISLLT